MKKSLILIIAMITTAEMASAQMGKVLELEVGYLHPKDISGGMIYSGKYGLVVDERVDLSLGVDFFHSQYAKETTVEYGQSGQVGYETKVRSLDYSAYLLPISLNATVRFPIQDPFYLFVGAGFAYQLLFHKVTNYVDDVSETQRFRGTGWIFRAGLEWGLGTHSGLLVETFYDLGKVTRNLEETPDGLPRWDEVNLGGFGIRGGLKMRLARY